MDLAVVRIYGSIAIILGCFIFLYPKLMHPLVMTLFGMNTKNTEPKTPDINDLPPYLRDKAKMAESKSAGVKDELPDHIRRMRSGPHPGMRAAAAEQSRQQTKGSGKGMMGVILPMYAVGIVVYLVYTLFKVFNKKDDKDKSRRSPSRNTSRTRDDYEEMGDNSADEGRVSRRKKEMVTPQDLQNELQSLVSKVQDKNLTEMDMRKLQERLAETEAQMTKILAAMQAVQGKVDVAAKSSQVQDQTVPQDASNNQSSKSTQNIKEESIQKKDEASTESSPASSESYEIVNKPEKDGSNTDIETVQSKSASDDVNEPSQLQDLDDETNEIIDEEEEEGNTDDVEDVLMEEKKNEEEKNVTVRQRVTKKEDTDS